MPTNLTLLVTQQHAADLRRSAERCRPAAEASRSEAGATETRRPTGARPPRGLIAQVARRLAQPAESG